MQKKVTTTVAPPSPEETAYLATQTKLAQMQLEALEQQQAFTADYQATIKPVMAAQAAIIKAQTDAALDPAQQAIAKQTAALQLKQLEEAGALLPLQKKLLESQLQQIEQGYKATPEQIKLIDETIASNLAMGKSDLLEFSENAMTQLRDELAPSLGLRPSDTPITDRGGEIAEEGIRQYGQLERSLQGAGAEAKLNYPLAAAGVSNQSAQFQQNLMLAQQELAGRLSQQAASNRLSLAGVAGQPVQMGIGAGLGLANASAPNPLQFARGGTTTQSGGMFSSILGGLGGLGEGLGAMGVSFSDERLKVDVKDIKVDAKGRRWVSFRYLGEKTNVTRFGVIAQSTFFTDPDAVSVGDDGYLQVDYAKLIDDEEAA